MEVGRDRIGVETFLEGLHRRAENEAPASVTNVEYHAAFLCRKDRGVDLAIDQLTP